MKTCERHIHTELFDLYFYHDSVTVLPPSRLMVGLAQAQVRGAISDTMAKAVLRSWLNRFTLALSTELAPVSRRTNFSRRAKFSPPP